MGGREDFVKLLENAWPVAYAEYSEDGNHIIDPLYEHLSLTARLSIDLFEDRLKVIEKRIGWREGELVEAMYLAALLHDMAKSSKYYLDMFKRYSNVKIMFPRHELASALLLEMAGNLYTGTSIETGIFVKIVRTAARAIARHHSAMKHRHPTQAKLQENVIKEIIKGIDIDVVRKLRALSPCIRMLKSEIYDKIFNLLEIALYKCCHGSHDAYKYIVNLKRENPDEIQATIAVTGFLMLADNVVANSRRRISDDGTTSAYIKYWTYELDRKLRSVGSIMQMSRFQC